MSTPLFGKLVLAAALNDRVRSFTSTSDLSRGLVRRFVAGENLDDAIAVVRQLNANGQTAALACLGENISTEEEARQATTEIVRALEHIHAEHLTAYLSVKPTQIGLDLGEHVVQENAIRILSEAARFGNFVRLDMEGSTYTARTIEIFEALRSKYENVGIVLQAYLYRSMRDAVRLREIGASIRLCKGAYGEPPHISFRRKKDTDRNYVKLMEFLLSHGHRPALATHDSAIIEHAVDYVHTHSIPPDLFEFQMLFGVRRDLQESLTARGFTVRVYVPYGSEWYPYLTRRLAERPANMFSIASSVLRERQAKMK